MVAHAKSVVAPDDGGAAHAAACRDAAAAFARFAGFTTFGSEPVLAEGCGREGTDGGGLERGCEKLRDAWLQWYCVLLGDF